MGGAKQDETPVSHAATSPCCHNLTNYVILWQSHPKMKKLEPRFMGVTILKCQM